VGAAKLKVKSWRLRVFLVELERALKDEREGEAVVINMDESYVHQGHCANMTWLPMDDNGNPITGLNRQVRDGQRLILVIATSRWGPIVVRDELGRPHRRPCVGPALLRAQPLQGGRGKRQGERARGLLSGR